MAYNLNSAKDRLGNDIEPGIVKRTEAGVYSGCEGLVCNWVIDAAGDLSDIPSCAPSSFAWLTDLSTVYQLSNAAAWTEVV
jgi:hypothetical protein